MTDPVMSEAQKLEFAVLRAAVISKVRHAWRLKQLRKPIPGRWTVVPRGSSAWH